MKVYLLLLSCFLSAGYFSVNATEQWSAFGEAEQLSHTGFNVPQGFKGQALAKADFNRDRVLDLIVAYGDQRRGGLSLHWGNNLHRFPNSKEAQLAKNKGTFTLSPFLNQALWIDLDQVPTHIVAGDYDADGFADILVATQSSTDLVFLRGNGHGHFEKSQSVALPGTVTALWSGDLNRRDGLPAVAIGVENGTTHALVILQGLLGAMQGIPAHYPQTSRINAITSGRIDDGHYRDLAIGTDTGLTIIWGRDHHNKKYKGTQATDAFPIEHGLSGLAATHAYGKFGDFLVAQDKQGQIWQIPRVAYDGDNATLQSQRIFRGVMPPAKPDQFHLVRASGLPGEEWVVLTDDIWHHHPFYLEESLPKTAQFALPNPIALLPMNLGKDALTDLVALDQSGQISLLKTRAAATFEVNSTDDVDDGTCDVTHCSLREALNASNANPGVDTITFNMPDERVLASNSLSFTDPVTVDGASQPGGFIRIDGSPASMVNGVSIGNASTLRSVRIAAFNSSRQLGIFGEGTLIDQSTTSAGSEGLGVFGTRDHVIQDSHMRSFSDFGLIFESETQDTLIQNTEFGVRSSQTVVGMTAILAFDPVSGLTMRDSSTLSNSDEMSVHGFQDALFQGNTFGHEEFPPFGGIGIWLRDGSNGNTIGGTTPGTGNTFVGKSRGIEIEGDDTVVYGNNFGILPEPPFDTYLGQAINIEGDHNIIGDDLPEQSNLIAHVDGAIFLQTGIENRVVGNQILEADGGFNISGHSNDPGDGDEGNNRGQNYPELVSLGINSQDQVIANYHVDTNPANATYPLEIHFYTAEQGLIGFYAGTLIAKTIFTEFDYQNGGRVDVLGQATDLGLAVDDLVVATATDAANNSSIASQTVAIAEQPNAFLVVNSLADGTPGDCDAADCTFREAILAGLALEGQTPEMRFDLPGDPPYRIVLDSPLPQLTGPFILDATSQTGYDGSPIVLLDGSNTTGANGLTLDGQDVQIHGLAIGGFDVSGILLAGTGPHQITGNWLGTDPDGAAFPNQVGLTVALGSEANIIGTSARGNLMSGNTESGIVLGGSNNRFENNLIGLGSDGTTPLPNGSFGVLIDNEASTNVLEANTIAYNQGDGIRALSGTGNAFCTNNIFANEGPGIDLNGDGITLNDLLDVDEGPNQLQNYPVGNSVYLPDEGGLWLTGRLESTPNTEFTLSIFHNETLPTEGQREGRTHLGNQTVMTNENGIGFFDTAADGDIQPGHWVTLTATDPTGNTSEFNEGTQVSIFSDGFESGDISRWSGQTPLLGSNLVVTGDAAYLGQFGLKVELDGAANTYVWDVSPRGENRYRARFFINADTLTLPADAQLDVFEATNTGSMPVVRFTLVGTTDGTYLRGQVLTDSGTWHQTPDVALPLGWNMLECDLASAADGHFALWLNENLVEQASLETATSLVENVLLGGVNGTSTASGSLSIDAFDSKRDAYLGNTACIPPAFFNIQTRNWPKPNVLHLVRQLDLRCPEIAVNKKP